MRISRMLLTVARNIGTRTLQFVAAIVEMATFNEETEADFSWENSG